MTVEDAYQAALKAEEKLARKQSQKRRGRSSTRGKGSSNRGIFQASKREAGCSSSQSPRGGESRGERFFSRGRGRGREIMCYTCGKTGHMSWDCPENKSTNQRGAHIVEAKEETMNAEVKEETLEMGESLMLKRVLIKVEKETHEPTQIKSLFKTMCKSKGKCCKVVIDSGSADILVSTNMVEKLGLQRMAHPTSNEVSCF
jgi:hypothetical protein